MKVKTLRYFYKKWDGRSTPEIERLLAQISKQKEQRKWQKFMQQNDVRLILDAGLIPIIKQKYESWIIDREENITDKLKKEVSRNRMCHGLAVQANAKAS